MDIEVRMADARDRNALDEFYNREGMSFRALSSRPSLVPIGKSKETMYIVAVAENIVVAALKLDIGKNPTLGNVGYIQHFEIEDELEATDIGFRMLQKTLEIADEKDLRALDAVVSEERGDVIDLYIEAGFDEEHKEVYLRREFRSRIF